MFELEPELARLKSEPKLVNFANKSEFEYE